MLGILTTTGRVLMRHWPALLVWFLAGITARYFIIELAGFIGGYTSTIGLLILPLAVLARLVSFVGMFLVLRDGLRNLQEIAPVPESGRERRAMFQSSLLASILPFFAVYAAWGDLRDDVAAYGRIALDVSTANNILISFSGGEVVDTDVATDVSIGPWTILIVAIAFAGRWAWKRWSGKLPRVLSLAAVYLEVLWVFFAVALIGQVLDTVGGWVDSRVAIAWLADLRMWVGEQLVLVAWIWDGIEWLLGEAGGILLKPLAWLAVAGVIYGQTIVAEKLRIENRLIAQARERAERVPSAVRKRAGDLANELTSRFKPIGAAILLMWRAGPVMIAGYVLLYTIVLALEPLAELGVLRIIGPQAMEFWVSFAPLVGLIPLMVVESLRISLIAGTYDRTLRATRLAAESASSGEPPPVAPAAQGSIENRTNDPAAP